MSNATAASELSQMDLGVLDQLATLQTELEQIDQRLSSMESRRDAVAEEVYNRVRRDYMSQRKSLQESAEPLREQARGLYTRVKAALLELDREYNTVQMDLEEIDFRHSLGEFDEAEKENRSKAKAKLLKERQKARDEAQALRARFNKAFPALEQEAGDVGKPSTRSNDNARANESEDPTQRVNKFSEDEIRTAELPSPEEAKPTPPPAPAAAKAAEPPAPPPRRNPDATVVFRPARLTDQATDQPGGPYTLGLKPLSIGSDPRCDVKVEGVAARQAEVGPSRSGFILRDLAGGVTTVNGQGVDELLLKDGDLIQIGSLSLRFSQV
jgi:hypothetical protein